MEERRKYTRIPEETQISYKVIPAGIKTSEFTTKDISQGGIRFLVHQFIPQGRRLKIRLNLYKTSVAIEALVRLVWIRKMPHSEPYEIGVEFVDLPPKGAERIVNFIKEFLNIKG